jgi:hypothetical protein
MVLAEGWLRQRRKVRDIATRARHLRRETREIRRRMGAWFSPIENPEILGWSFAAGLIWASGRGQTPRRVANERTLLRLANSILLAWEFVHRVRSRGAALGLGRPHPRRGLPADPPPAERGPHG